MESNQPQQKSNGAFVGSIIIIVILIIGGIYFWQKSLKDKIENQENSTATNDTASLDAEANSIDLEGLDNGI